LRHPEDAEAEAEDHDQSRPLMKRTQPNLGLTRLINTVSVGVMEFGLLFPLLPNLEGEWEWEINNIHNIMKTNIQGKHSREMGRG
jgi:hypothetical protein